MGTQEFRPRTASPGDRRVGIGHAPILADSRRRSRSAWARFLESIADEEIELVDPTRTDLLRMAELVRKYADFPLGAVDAAVSAVAERLDVKEVATLFRRHFSAVRTNHPVPLRLLPE
ncbi:hypothetical protein [Nocardia sp. CY41]|uniref:hypothetical protein n=1 Tax=Nocardia sp. CY41 TaxID=2608686 RepID=UPI001915010E|nr:hypothetical protein [Nocardia sp. CY41]